MSQHSTHIVFHGKQQVALETKPRPEPAAGQVLIKAHKSLMSTGTENIVFNRLFDEGTHWDRWVKYPFHPGYALAGDVVAIGEGVSKVKVGDRVAVRAGHGSYALVAEAACYAIPDGLAYEEAVWFALAKIAFVGAKAAAYRLGDKALIIGAGPIGQMSLRWAKASGVETVVMVDPLAEREAVSLSGGAAAYIRSGLEAAEEEIKNASRGEVPGIVIDSTGNAAVFAAALKLAPRFGRVVILGDTGSPGKQVLTGDVIIKGLTITGAHDGHQIPGFGEADITRLFFELVTSGRFSLAGLNTHTFAPDACVEAYATANRDRAKTMGILFDWASH
jgi:2-desacetyl-2-hydroxyethyl bacteriochlorophyllide A dehydrogenase